MARSSFPSKHIKTKTKRKGEGALPSRWLSISPITKHNKNIHVLTHRRYALPPHLENAETWPSPVMGLSPISNYLLQDWVRKSCFLSWWFLVAIFPPQGRRKLKNLKKKVKVMMTFKDMYTKLTVKTQK